MAKGRSSISERGLEILLGAPSPVDIKPRGAAQPVPPAGQPQVGKRAVALSTSASQPHGGKSKLEEALRAEASAGTPGSEEQMLARSALAMEPPLTPEIQLAFAEGPGAADKPLPGKVRVPILALEGTMGKTSSKESVAIRQPPPPQSPEVPPGLLPPRTNQPIGGRDRMEPSEAVADIQDTGRKKVEPYVLPDRQLTDEEEQQLLARLDDARIQALDQQITQAYDQVLTQVGENEDIANECYNQLLQARDIVLRREAARIPQAEYYVEQVWARLKRASDSEIAAKKYAWWITGWGFLWGAVFLAVLVLLNQSALRALVVPPILTQLSVDMQVLLSAMIWGGIGGVVAVWYSLFKHVGQRDFDSQYNLSYVGKPFLGLVLGATVYMFFLLLLNLRILPIGLQQGYETGAAVVTPWIIYPVAWASGFKENRIFDLVNRVMKRLFLAEEDTQPALSAEPGGSTQ
jgi:hypothetical protein